MGETTTFKIFVEILDLVQTYCQPENTITSIIFDH